MGWSEKAANLFLLALAGIGLRLLIIFSSYQLEISNRVEVSTPVTSWKRAVEGVYLLNQSISPYDGDTFHEDPISLHFYRWIIHNASPWIPFVFIATDVLTGLFLGAAGYLQFRDVCSDENKRTAKLKKEDAAVLAIDGKALDIAVRVVAIHLLSPYSIGTCTAQATSVFTNLIVALTLLSATTGLRLTACALTAYLTLHSLYPLVLIIPVSLIIERKRQKGDPTDFKSRSVWFSLAVTIVLFVSSFLALLTLSYIIAGERWSFMTSTVTVPDLTPNIGLFWYFFTEMFEHFRYFFLCTFQINAFIYALPLGITLRRSPHLMFFVMLILLSLLKPYPSISDLSLYLTLLPVWSHLTAFMKQGLIIGGILVTTSVLAPIMWHMWIMMGTANSNFYFAVTLAYNTAQIFLVTDLLFANVKREFFLDNGIVEDKDGQPAKLELVH